MVCLGLKPGLAGWKVQTNPLRNSGTPILCVFYFIEIMFSRLAMISLYNSFWKTWTAVVVVAQLVEQLLLELGIHGLNPVMGKFYLLSTV